MWPFWLPTPHGGLCLLCSGGRREDAVPGAEGRKEAKPPAWLQISGQSGGEAGGKSTSESHFLQLCATPSVGPRGNGAAPGSHRVVGNFGAFLCCKGCRNTHFSEIFARCSCSPVLPHVPAFLLAQILPSCRCRFSLAPARCGCGLRGWPGCRHPAIFQILRQEQSRRGLQKAVLSPGTVCVLSALV